MFTNQQNVQSVVPSPGKISVLLVSPYVADQTVLSNILKYRGWLLSQCATASEALPLVRSTRPAVVICESDLTDGSWRSMLAACEELPGAPLLLVTSRNADESLWAEVLNLGGYDVLPKPFEPVEVTRVIEMAGRQWYGHNANIPC